MTSGAHVAAEVAPLEAPVAVAFSLAGAKGLMMAGALMVVPDEVPSSTPAQREGNFVVRHQFLGFLAFLGRSN